MKFPSPPAHCMWAGRLQQGGGAAFAALGPAKITAELKGKGKGTATGTSRISTRRSSISTSSSTRVGHGRATPQQVMIAEALGLPPASSTAASSSSTASGEAPGQPQTAATKRRADFPVIRQVQKAIRSDVLTRMETSEGRKSAIDRIIEDFAAPSSRTSQSARWRTWQEFHRAMLGDGIPVLPLTSDGIVLIAACFKDGGYRSFKNYMSKAREQHTLAGHSWTDILTLTAKKATASVERGLGPARQSSPFDLLAAIEVAKHPAVVKVPGAPVGWHNLLTIAVYFILREIEVAAACVGHVTLDTVNLIVHLRLPASKTDQTGVGCSRSWQCLCRDRARRVDCPYHAAVDQTELLGNIFGCPVDPQLPLFPDRAGLTVSKAAVVKTIEATIEAMGLPLKNDMGGNLYGGHSFRVTGARRLAALGVEVAKIMILARWSSEAVFRYIKDAPLTNLPAEVAALEEQEDLRNKIGVLSGELASMQGRIAETEDRTRADLAAAMAEMTRKCAPAAQKMVVAKLSGRKRKVHHAAACEAEANPSEWRTLCGLAFAGWRFSRHASVDAFPEDVICKNCFQQQPSAAADDSSSSSSTDGSASCEEKSD